MLFILQNLCIDVLAAFVKKIPILEHWVVAAISMWYCHSACKKLRQLLHRQQSILLFRPSLWPISLKLSFSGTMTVMPDQNLCCNMLGPNKGLTVTPKKEPRQVPIHGQWPGRTPHTDPTWCQPAVKTGEDTKVQEEARADQSGQVDHMTGTTGSKVPNWQTQIPNNQHSLELANKLTNRSIPEVARCIARTPVSYYLDEEELDQQWALELVEIMEENMAAWKNLMDNYHGLLSMDR
jgi:hypothetical protein